MRKWGILITGFYTLVLLFLLDPVAVMLFDRSTVPNWGALPWWYEEQLWLLFIWAAVLITGQALLLFVSVDTSFRRIQQRRHITVAVGSVALMVGLLSGMAIWAVVVAVGGDNILPEADLTFGVGFLGTVAVFWIGWAIVFYRFKAGQSEKLQRLVTWLIRGSILELLIVVPCHVIVRNREDCSAPGVTAYGIATGIAVMLMAFGPSVMFLYQKRLAEYQSRSKIADS